MKSSLHYFFFSILVLFTFWQVDLKANPEIVSATASNVREYSIENLIPTNLDVPCYPPDWLNTYNVGQNCATWSWQSCYGANSYNLQWRYPNGNWCNLPGVCSQTYVNVINLQSCTAYEWRVRANCSYGCYSSWCYQQPFTTLCDYCETPSGCYSNNIHDCSATFHWSEIWGAQSYDVQIRFNYGSWTYVPESPCGNNWVTCYNLQPGTNYEWRVRAHCSYNSYSDWTYTNYFTTLQSSYCPPPDWLQCYNVTDCCATWKWAGMPGADYYSIQWCYQGGSWTDYGGPYYGTWCNVNFLHSCTTYQWRVKCYCQYGGWSNWCYPNTFTSSCTNSCSVPSGLITKDIGDYQATFKWASVYGATSYSVQLKDPAGNWYDVPGSPTTGVWITVNNLSSCKSYEWRVRSNCNYDSHSYWSNSMPFTTTCGNGCNAPQWVYTNGISNTSATLHWAPVDGADYYVVEWRSAGGTWYELQGGPWTNTFTDITGLLPGTTYEWHVKTHCHSGYLSGWSPTTTFSTGSGLSCGMPFFRWTSPISDSTAKFNWTSVSGALNYTVQIRIINGPWLDVVGSPTADTSIVATGLANNTQYEWRMQVNCNNGGYSPWLSSILFHTGSSAGCATPGSLFADNLTLTSATLNWAPVQGAETYSVEIRLVPLGSWNPVLGSPFDTNAVVVDGLSPFTTYEYHVRSNCAGGLHSFESSAVQFTTTNQPTCTAPDTLVSRNITETTATLSWSVVQGAMGYHVQTRLPNGTWIDIPGGVVTDTTVIATGFTPNTTFEWRVRSECSISQFSKWSYTATLTTTGVGPDNDDCATAMLLTVETNCVPTFASNINASASNPPPVGGCWTNGYRDVWFKFAMPDVLNPTVTIRTTAGSLANAVMEVYTGTDCGVKSFIACEDNNDNGNGSSMPVINLTGTPNAIIWVRVWGFDGSTGTFSICVFNYISLNYNGVADAVTPDVGEPIYQVDKDVVAIQKDVLPEIRISPNPVSDQLNVVVQQTEQSRVIGLKFVDLSGKIMLSQEIEPAEANEYKTRIDVSDFIPGIYVLQVQTTSGMMTKRVSVVK